mmetsp:Transcript_7199/g.15706  ORF Transcript_7199/g.15706 Transcript_7199/m.15706 type:complete len:234 (-) Transcript_7199:371-1072(-)
MLQHVVDTAAPSSAQHLQHALPASTLPMCQHRGRPKRDARYVRPRPLPLEQLQAPQQLGHGAPEGVPRKHQGQAARQVAQHRLHMGAQPQCQVRHARVGYQRTWGLCHCVRKRLGPHVCQGPPQRQSLCLGGAPLHTSEEDVALGHHQGSGGRRAPRQLNRPAAGGRCIPGAAARLGHPGPPTGLPLIHTGLPLVQAEAAHATGPRPAAPGKHAGTCLPSMTLVVYPPLSYVP